MTYKDATCGFCGKGRADVNKLIAGPNAYICDVCIKAVAVVADGAGGKQQRQPPLRRPTPRELYEKLGEFVVGQEHARRILAVAVVNHYKRLERAGANEKGPSNKSNVLLLGPTGCGKTLLAQSLARILDVPFAMSDTTLMTATGYIGDDADVCITHLYLAAGCDPKRAERGIVYIDEIDKCARRSSLSNHRDISGESVQQSLLKLLEGTAVRIKTDDGKSVQINTSNVLFICGGAFADLLIQRSEKPKSLGFGAKEEAVVEQDVTRTELTKYGMLPELLGRLPVTVTMQALSIDELAKIVTEPTDSVLRQYEDVFHADGSELVIPIDGARAIAERAIAMGVGARGIRSLVEELLLDTMFDLPERPGTYILDAAAVAAGAPTFWEDYKEEVSP